MSRPRRAGPRYRAGAMPDWLVTYRPEQWAEDLNDMLEVYYFGRCAWLDARKEWLAGGNPQPKIKSPRPVQGGSVNTSSIPEDRTPGPTPTPPDVHEWRIDGP